MSKKKSDKDKEKQITLQMDDMSDDEIAVQCERHRIEKLIHDATENVDATAAADAALRDLDALALIEGPDEEAQ